MDPLIHLLTQTQRNMLDNTQKSSDSLRTQQDKELKAKKSRASSVDLADLSADCNQMGEDLLGSMDPDLFGRSGGAEAFKKRWEEMISEEELEEDEREQEQEEEESAQEDDEFSEEDEEEEVSSDQEVPPSSVVVGDQVELEELEHGKWSRYREEGPSEEEGGHERDEVEEEMLPDSVTLDSARVEAAGAEQLDLPVEEGEDEGPVGDDSERRPGQWSSLLDHGEGFLLAEGRIEAEAEFDEIGEEALPEVSPTLAALTEKLIVGEVGSRSYVRLQALLSRFGAGVLRLCLSESVKVYLLPRETSLASHPSVSSLLPDASLSNAVYVPESRTCIIEEECLLQAPRHFHPVLYYFALAFDHALGDGGFASLKSPAVSANFQACSEGLKGHQFADPLAETTPAHYFAQAVEAYLQESDCRDPIWTRDDLYDFDRSMFDYVEYLFCRQNR